MPVPSSRALRARRAAGAARLRERMLAAAEPVAVRAPDPGAALRAIAAVSAAAPASAPDPIVHLLTRTSYGIQWADLKRARSIGYDDYLEEQLAAAIPDAALAKRLKKECPHLGLTPKQMINRCDEDDDDCPDFGAELVHATLLRRFASKRQLFETVVEFWSDHFSIYLWDDYQNLLKLPNDREVVRKLALTRFSRLVQAFGHSPSMLSYLDNDPSSKLAPNENYGRELMELHTLGVKGGYTELDVVAVARCLTGFSIDWDWDSPKFGQFQFNEWDHDEGAKTVLGHVIPAGGGQEDGETVYSILGNHPSAATFIATKLCRRYVADLPPQSAIDRVAASFAASGGDIKTVLRTLFKSPEFLASAGQKLKRPMEFMLSALRTLGAKVGRDAFREELVWLGWELGHLPFDWAPPNGYPDVGRYWANSTGLLNRWNVSSAIAFNWFDHLKVDYTGLLAEMKAGKPSTPRGLAEFATERLLRRALTAEELQPFVDYAAQGGGAAQTLSKNELGERARGVVALVLASTYFQWR
jgi:hypothetical protein